MSQKLLNIADGVPFPPNASTQKIAWIGTSGGGKTYGAMKFAEELYRQGAQFVTLDPVGVWYGLRLDKSGKKPSDISIPIFGGLHGDIPLEATSGKLIADLITDKNLTVILDVSQFESDAEKARFAADFADRLFFRKKSSPSAIHIFLEECQEFVPQNPQREENRMLHVFVRLQKIGRNFGIGTSLITQRPQEVSKKALNLAGTLFAFRTTGAHERKAIELWMQDNSVEEKDIVKNLPHLDTGNPYLWSPEWLKISQVVQILAKRTFDASATPEVGDKAVKRDMGDIDLEKIRAEMSATIEKARAEDPKALHKEIKRLSAELARKPGQVIPIDPQVIQRAVDRAVAARDKEWSAKFHRLDLKIRKASEILTGTAIAPPSEILSPIPTSNFSVQDVVAENYDRKTTDIGRESLVVETGVDVLSGPGKRILDGLGSLESFTSNPPLPLVAAAAEYSVKSSSFIKAMSQLRSRNLIDGTRLTEKGKFFSKVDRMFDQSEIHRKILSILSGPESRVMSILLDGAAHSDAQLATAADYSPNSSSYIKAKSHLRSKGLLVSDSGTYSAAEFLFI